MLEYTLLLVGLGVILSLLLSILGNKRGGSCKSVSDGVNG